VKLHEIEMEELGIDRFVILPALSVTMREMYESAKRVAERVNTIS
jgi:hypothetical protein